jgi:parallel beta-helix repeat protein
MARKLSLLLILISGLSPFAFVTSRAQEVQEPAPSTTPTKVKKGTKFYVRQTVGDDTNDGKSPQTAWKSISKLSSAMHAGDTAYIGPGLYRDKIMVLNEGSPDARITFIADSTGQHTGDPPGVVMITGAEPVDENIFVRHSEGVYKAKLAPTVLGLTEMDGPQYRYYRVTQMKEYLVDKIPAVNVVAKYPASWYYDDEAQMLYIHTTDGKPPNTHHIEIIRRVAGISTLEGHRHITVIGFTFRHEGDSGIYFYKETGDGVAINNTVYGSRQGIRAYNSVHISLYGNTLFRNENSGAYFLKESTNAQFINNVSYENVKGVRWGSQSVNGLALGNTLFDNLEAGISVEDVFGAVLRNNQLSNNKETQLKVLLDTEYDSDNNCFQNGNAEQAVSHFSNVAFYDRQKSLPDYQKVKGRDLHSREGGCQIPQKLDVQRLHSDSMNYADRARKLISAAIGRPLR